MDRIASFSIDHEKLLRGVYVSRVDVFNGVYITTFDIRMKRPNKEAVMGTADMHAMEHLGATFLRNHKEYGDKTVYFGPMGCRTGFYLILAGEYTSEAVLPLIKELYLFMRDFHGAVPGASPVECGNFSDMDLDKAKEEATSFIELLENAKPENLNYPGADS